jgi:hypothetical protein
LRETGKSDTIYNIRKDLEAGFDELAVVCLSGKIKNDVLWKLREVELDKNTKIRLYDKHLFKDYFT